MTGETPRELAKAYVEALESRADGEEYEAAQEHLDALRDRLERFEGSYGGSDPATEELREKVQSAEDEVADLEQQRRKPEELGRELLEATTGFMLDDEWLKPDVIGALNRVLVGAPHNTLRVGDLELSGPGDAEDLDDVARFDIIDVVRKIALDKLGEGDDLERVWRSIEGSTKEVPFMMVVETGGASASDVAARIDEDIDRNVAENRLKNAVHQLDISPYHRQDGTYSPSTAGLYIAAEYAESPAFGETESGDSVRGENRQTMLSDELAASNGDGADG